MGNKTLIILSLLLCLFCSCKKDGGVCLSSTGEQQTEMREIASFTKLEISNNVGVEVYPNETSNWVEVIGGKHLLKGIEVKNQGSSLVVKNNNRCNWLRSFKKEITVRIHTKDFSDMMFYGSGDVVFKDTLRTKTFTLNCWDASGDVTFLLNTNETYLKLHTGTANLTLYGFSSFVYYYGLSTGFIFGKQLQCETAFLSQDGYGDMYINPSKSLKAEIKKSGNIYYPGKISVELNRSGSGELLTF